MPAAADRRSRPGPGCFTPRNLFNGSPSTKMRCFAITGTNGKTTSTICSATCSAKSAKSAG
jgi:UDP-N-acetylmuramyl tripeptide synthase